MAQLEQLNYFFVVEEGRDSTIYARGGYGKEVLSALARLSLTELSAVESSTDRLDFGKFESHELYTPTRKALTGFETAEPYDHARFSLNTRKLSNLMHRSDPEHSSREDVARNSALLDRIREGVRSPESVDRELSLQFEDKQLLQSVAKNWFNRDGLRLSPPAFRKWSSGSDLDLLRLFKVEKTDRGLDAVAKEALFKAVPKNGQAYSIQRAPFNRHKTHGHISIVRPFLHGLGVMHETFGYVASDTKEFVPVLTKLSDAIPARRAK